MSSEAKMIFNRPIVFGTWGFGMTGSEGIVVVMVVNRYSALRAQDCAEMPDGNTFGRPGRSNYLPSDALRQEDRDHVADDARIARSRGRGAEAEGDRGGRASGRSPVT